MWSNFAQRQPPAPPPQPHEAKEEDAGDDAWDDHDDIDLDDDAPPGGTGARALRSFAATRHEPLSLALGGPPPPAVAPPAAAGLPIGSSAAAPPAQVEPPAPAESGGEGWDDDDAFFDDSIEATTPRKETAPAPAKSTPLGRVAEKFGAALLASMEPQDDEGGYSEEVDEPQQPQMQERNIGAGGALGRAAESFGAALLASVDRDEDEDDQQQLQEEEQLEEESAEGRGGGFGGGFVMKGLSRFIEAATAPQERDDDSDDDDGGEMDDGGWGDDDDLDFHDDDAVDQAGVGGDEKKDSSLDEGPAKGADGTGLPVQEEPVLPEEPTNGDGGMDGGEGWDDIDVSFDSPAKPDSAAALQSQTAETAPEVAEMPPQEEDAPASATAVDDDDLGVDAAGDGWDDVEISFNSPPPKAPLKRVEEERVDSGAPVLETEIALSELCEDSGAAGSFATAKDENIPNVAEVGVSKSLTHFVDNLDAELGEFAGDTAGAAVSDEKKVTIEPAPEEEPAREYSYEDNKDESPEPVDKAPPPAARLPHQQSWYINSMEGGMGGVVYGEESLEPTTVLPLPAEVPKGLVLPAGSDILSSRGSVVRCPSSVGMPLSEMPSTANSLGESENSEAGDGAGPNDPIQRSELQCKCLELVMPLPADNDNGSSQEPGFGTKTLPDGTTVMVNYEKLLQNEATKRILLQRSFESLRAKHQASSKSVREQEEARELLESQLASAQEQISSLNEMVLQLQDEKENMVNEAQLFEAELAASKNDKEYLESEVEAMRGMETSLRESQAEKTRLIDQVEVLQSDLSEARQESSRLVEDKNLLEQERDQLNGKVEELMSAAATATADETGATSSVEVVELRNTIDSLHQELLEKGIEIDDLNEERDSLNVKLQEVKSVANAGTEAADSSGAEREALRSRVESLQQELLQKDSEHLQASNEASAEHDSLREDHSRLQGDLSETKSALSRLQDENESLRAMQREYDVQMSDLRAAVESMDGDALGEVDRLAAEVASMKYELGVKSSELEESASTIAALQSKLDNAEARLAESSSSSQADHSLTVENDALNQQLTALQGAYSLLESQKSELEQNLAEKSGTIQSLENHIQGLDAMVEESASIKEEFSQARASLGEKSKECEQFTSALLATQAKLDAAEAQLAEINRVSKEGHPSEVEQSLRAQVDVLSKQLADLQGTYSALEMERASAAQSIEKQTHSLDAKVAELTNLRGELSRVRKALDDKTHECQTIATTCEKLQAELFNTQSDREVVLAKSQENADLARAQISQLQAQVADLLRDHNSTMKNVEEQLTDSLQHNATLRAQCEEYRVKLESVEKECTNMSQSTSEAMAKYTEQISTLEGENLELSSALQAAQSALEAKQVESSGENSRVQQLQRSAEAMKQEMESIAYRHQELMDKNHSLMQEKADMAQSLEARASEAEQQANLMQLECAKLRSSFDSAQKASADAKQTVATLTEQLEALKGANAQLEDKLFEASFETPETERLAAENASLRKERDNLKEETLSFSQRINDLVSRNDDNGAFTAVEKEALLARINELEAELKAENLNELRDELTSIQEERQQLDLDNEELLVQLGLMQQDRLENQAEIEVEVETLREEVATLREKCDRLQSDLDEATANSSLPGQKDHVKALLDEKNALCQTISQLKDDNASLKDEINALTQKTEGLELQNSQTIKTLRQKLGLLELKLADREEEVESARKEMRTALDSKDKELSELRAEYSSREEELKTVSSKLEAANHEMGSFNSQLENLQGQNDEDQYGPPLGGAEEEKFYENSDDDISLQDLLAEAVLDSDDYLRSQIVVLAQALERSELQRADALERVMSERKANSESLRQLGESVKRFYTTVKSSGQ